MRVGCWFEWVYFVPALLLEINKAICLILQQLTVIITQKPRIVSAVINQSHTPIRMPQQYKTLLTTVEIWYNTVGTLSVSFKVSRRTKLRKHTESFCLDLTLHSVTSGLINAKLLSRTLSEDFV